MSTTPRPSPFPPPSRHNIAIGEVFSLRGENVVVSGLFDTKAVCHDSTGKARSIAFDKLTDTFHKVGFNEAIAFQKRVSRLVKTTTKSATPKKDKTKPASKPAAKPAAKRAPKKTVNAPAPGPNPSLN